MKKVILLIVFTTVCFASSFAQARLGGFLGYGSEIEQWGIGINAEFFLNEKVAIAPNLLFYFPEKRNDIKYSYWELNGNFHYYLLEEDAISLYGLAGLNLISFQVKSDLPGFDNEETESELGLNLGLGVNFNFGGNVLPFTELKYVAGDADQAVIMLGVKFPIRD